MTRHENLDQKGMRRAIGDFVRALKDAGFAATGLVFYAGHGLQLDGHNYLIPVDARIDGETDVPIEAVEVSDVMASIEQVGNGLNIVILDACRDNPFEAFTRSAARGLATVDAPVGSIVAYATAPGAVAVDGEGGNSPYSAALARIIAEPGVPIERAFKLVRLDVHKATGGKQTPWESSSLTGDFYFHPPAESGASLPGPEREVPAAAGADEPTPDVGSAPGDPLLAFYRALEANTVEAYEDFLGQHPEHEKAEDVRKLVRSLSDDKMWTRVSEADSIAAYGQYLLVFPDGVYADVAEKRIVALRQPRAPARQPVEAASPRPLPQDSSCGHPHGAWSVTGIGAGDVLNVRSGPGARYNAVGSIPRTGAGVSVGSCAADGKWCRVRYRCVRGWAAVAFLSDGSAPAAPSGNSGLYRVVGHAPSDMLNVRAGPGTAQPIVVRIPHDGAAIKVGTCQAVSGSSSKWCRVSYGGVSGWASARYLADMATGARPD